MPLRRGDLTRAVPAPDEFLGAAERRLGDRGYASERTTVADLPAIVARDSRLRLWHGKLYVTVVVAGTDVATAEVWRRFVGEAEALATAGGGSFLGYVAGVTMDGVVPVLAAAKVERDAGTEARDKPSWAHAVSTPALIDLSTGRTHCYDGFVLDDAAAVPHMRSQRDLVTSIAS